MFCFFEENKTKLKKLVDTTHENEFSQFVKMISN